MRSTTANHVFTLPLCSRAPLTNVEVSVGYAGQPPSNIYRAPVLLESRMISLRHSRTNVLLETKGTHGLVFMVNGLLPWPGGPTLSEQQK